MVDDIAEKFNELFAKISIAAGCSTASEYRLTLSSFCLFTALGFFAVGQFAVREKT